MRLSFSLGLRINVSHVIGDFDVSADKSHTFPLISAKAPTVPKVKIRMDTRNLSYCEGLHTRN